MHVQCMMAGKQDLYSHAARLVATLTSSSTAGIVTAAAPRVAGTTAVGVCARVPVAGSACSCVSINQSRQAPSRNVPVALVFQDMIAFERGKSSSQAG
jgi:hypothetical protein